MFADLHLHSTFSDGTDTPLELCHLALENNLRVISITDHDEVGCIVALERCGAPAQIRIIRGVEISCVRNRKLLHILGYYLDVHSPVLRTLLDQMAREKTRNTKINFEHALSLGVFDYSWERVLNWNGDQPRLSGVHVVKAMESDGYKVPNMGLWEMFRKHFVPSGEAYVDTETASGYDAIDAIVRAGGVPVVAHPKIIEDDAAVLDLLRYGAQGLEVYHPAHTAEETAKYLEMARSKGCYVTGGTDWHGKNNGRHIARFGMCGLAHAGYEILEIGGLAAEH